MFYADYKNLFVEWIFGGTVPKDIKQDYVTGKNNLYSAKSARWLYTIDNKRLSEGYTRDWSVLYEVFLQKELS